MLRQILAVAGTALAGVLGLLALDRLPVALGIKALLYMVMLATLTAVSALAFDALWRRRYDRRRRQGNGRREDVGPEEENDH